MMRASGVLLALALTFGIGAALSHAYLERSTPRDGSTVTVMPNSIGLEMTEAVELRFSTFKVYKLETRETELHRIHADAASLMNRMLALKNDETVRADAGLATPEATSKTISIKLKSRLEPGIYVVMWRVLSVDTHTTQDYIYFRYKPD
jgi:methionine-rich copper-binding protein CopC